MKFKGILRKFAAGGILSAVVISFLIIILTPAAEQFRDFLSNMLKQEAMEVIITAVDGNNDNVSENGETPSQIITFYFRTEKTAKNNVQPNLQCTLDDERPSPCTQKIKYPSLSKTHHVFQVKINDPNVKPSDPAEIGFTVLPSIRVGGVVLQNNSGVRNAEVVMDNNRRTTDDIGQFAFPFVLPSEDIFHTFIISVVDEKGQKLQCENKKLLLNPIGEVANLTFRIENYLCSSAVSNDTITTNNRSEIFKPEATLGYGRIDLLYNSTLIRKPTTDNSNDGLWNVSIYIDGPDLSNVSKVKYYLHPTFAPNNVVEVTAQNNAKFALDISAYGGFKLYTKVYCNCLKPAPELGSNRYVYSPDTVLDFTRFLYLRH